MSSELPKNFDPAAIDREVWDTWIAEKAFHAEPDATKKPYVIVIPPPNVTAALHLGHALNNTLQDILIRWHRMLGDNTVWLPGTDHAGIATQTVVEKRVLKEEGIKRTDFKREDFVAKIQAFKDEYEQVILNQLRKMGCSCDWDRNAFTMDEPRAKAVREAFFRLFKDGMIYRGKRLVNWDPVTLSTLADDEVEMEEVNGFFYYLKYPLDDGSGHVTVATTRPETMLGDTAIGINPKDPRAALLRGKKVRLPIVGRVIPIIEDDYVVMPDPNGSDPKAKFATGFLKVTPAHDENDWQLGIRHNLPVINVLAPDASISDKHGWTDIGDAGFLIGKSREEARKLIVDWFKANGLLEDVKPYCHEVGHSYRSHVPIEPYLSDQWYLKVTDDKLRGAAIRAMVLDQRTGPSASPGTPGEGRSEGSSTEQRPHPNPLPAYRERESIAVDAIRFYPERYARTFQIWHENLRDWCISQQVWWGHRIPVWNSIISDADGGRREDRAKDGKPSAQLRETIRLHEEFFESRGVKDDIVIQVGGDEVQTWLNLCPRTEEAEESIRALNQSYEDQWLTVADIAHDVVGTIEAPYSQDPDVLNTWFSSMLWPMSTLGWPEETPELKAWNPSSTLCTAREIITLWVSRMVMFNLYLRGCAPFTDVFIHAMIQDGDGRKMSKSLGNGVDPLDIIESHGTDAMRYTLTAMATNTQDVRMPVELDAKSGKNTSPKFDVGRGVVNKLWSIARFVLMNLEGAPVEVVDEQKWSMADRWIVTRFNRTMDEVNTALKDYRFDQYARACYDFVERDFSDWYVEASKPQMKNDATRGQTAAILASVLDASLRLLHPIIPFITEKLWWKLNEVRPARGLPGRIDCPTDAPRIVNAPFPTIGDVSQASEHIFPRIQEIVVAIRNVKNQFKVEPRKAVTVSVHAPGDSSRQIDALRGAIEQLAGCKLSAVGADVKPAEGSTRALAAGCELYIEGLVDQVADEQRATKRREELSKLITTLEGRLGNEGYIARAPAHLVQQTQQQLTDAKSELAKLA